MEWVLSSGGPAVDQQHRLAVGVCHIRPGVHVSGMCAETTVHARLQSPDRTGQDRTGPVRSGRCRGDWEGPGRVEVVRW